MVRDRLAAMARDIHRTVIAAERDSRQSIVSQMKLAIAVLDGEGALSAAPCVAQEVFEQISAACAHSAEGRKALIVAHAGLADLAHSLKLDARMFGGPIPKNKAELGGAFVTTLVPVEAGEGRQAA